MAQPDADWTWDGPLASLSRWMIGVMLSRTPLSRLLAESGQFEGQFEGLDVSDTFTY